MITRLAWDVAPFMESFIQAWIWGLFEFGNTSKYLSYRTDVSGPETDGRGEQRCQDPKPSHRSGPLLFQGMKDCREEGCHLHRVTESGLLGGARLQSGMAGLPSARRSKPRAFWSGSAGGPAVPSLAWQICVAHSWPGTVASVHQIYEQLICEKKWQNDDSVIVFYWNPQPYWDTYIIDFFHW